MQIPTISEVLEAIDAFCARHKMKPTRFGRDATGEPQLIDSMRNKGRVPSLTVLNKVALFMATYDAANPTPSTGQTDEMSREAVA